MKSRMKKIVGVLLSATMLLTMTMGVFAAGSSTTGAGGVRVDGATDVKITAGGEQPSAADIAAAGLGSNYSVLASYEITGSITDTNKGATVVFPVSGATASSKVTVLHKGSNGWEDLHGNPGAGFVSATTKSFSPFAVVADKSTLSNNNGNNDGKSPKTGESSMILGLGVLAMIAVAGAYGLNRKKAYDK